MLSCGCKEVMYTAISSKTRYLDKALKADSQLLDVPKNNSYKITTVIECPANQKVSYNIQYSLFYKDLNGVLNGEGEKSRRHITSFETTHLVKSGGKLAYKAEFKTPISDGKFIVKVGDSTILAKALTGKNVKVDYSFLLP